MGTKKSVIIPILISAVLIMLMAGCDDSGIAPKPGGSTEGPKPNIRFVPLSTFTYHYSTITQSGQERDTSWRSIDVVQNPIQYQGMWCYPIVSTTLDTASNPPPPIPPLQTLYVSYDTTTYILYQHGVKKVFDPSQTATWDKVADFSVPIGTNVFLFTITNLLGQNSLTADVNSAVQKDTVINTYNTGFSINCYKVAVVANIKLSGTPIGNAYLDYYVGYTPTSNPNNPSGRISVKVYPVNISGFPAANGLNQKIKTFSIP